VLVLLLVIGRGAITSTSTIPRGSPALDASDKVYFPVSRTIKAALLCFFFALCASAIVVTHRVHLQKPPPAPHQLFAVVERQLAAFRAADYSSAYRQAASGVQQKFTASQYEAMIRREYGDLSAAQRIEFGLVNVSGSGALVQVFLLGPNGSVRPFLYSLVAEGDSWKINGVQPMPSLPRWKRLSGLHI
jgi:Domain of unknown function (DUF4864)